MGSLSNKIHIKMKMGSIGFSKWKLIQKKSNAFHNEKVLKWNNEKVEAEDQISMKKKKKKQEKNESFKKE